MRLALVPLLLLAVGCGGQDSCQNGVCEQPGVVASSVLQKAAQRVKHGLGHEEQERSRAEDARFLMHSTFGPTRASLEELSGTTYQQWIVDQQQLPAGSHRAYYRERVMPPYDKLHNEKKNMNWPRATPCKRGRFRGFAFSMGDLKKSIEFAGTDSVSVDGVLRSELKGRPMGTSVLGFAGYKGYICHVVEMLGGDVILNTNKNCPNDKNRRVMNNPAMYSPSSAVPVEATLGVVKPGIVLLEEVQGACELTIPAEGSNLVIKVGSEYYIYEDRYVMRENTLEAPTTDLQSCTPMNHVNERDCVVGPIQEGDVAQGLLAEIWETPSEGGKYVDELVNSDFLGYIVDAEINHKVTFKGWTVQPNHHFAVKWTGSLTVKTAGSYTFYIDSDDASKLTVNDNLVADNGGWHGRREKQGVVTLTAGSHSIVLDFWEGNGDQTMILSWKGPDSGDVKEVVPKTALSTPSKGFVGCAVSCGSFGEVSNDPLLGNQFPIRLSSYHLINRDLDNRYANRLNQQLTKSVVWTMQALQADDQLRQRMAWALSQIFVVSTQGIGDDGFNEFWMVYYDIFVKNAFGNYRDIMSAVTFSPMMGRYLTHTGSSSYDANKNMPNENYAREIMQLFTIGLDLLNPDGTVVRNAAGEDVPTYTNEQILTFARIFTGFVDRQKRGNSEFYYVNRIDYMDIALHLHDVYAKPDLAGGYIGDGFPLCDDPLPSNVFLAKGARYEFVSIIGPKEEMGVSVLELAAGSTLKETLCGAEGKCSRAVVVLTEDVACSGDECGAEPPALVKVGSYFYRFVKPACVHLQFPKATETVAPPATAEPQQGWCLTETKGHIHWRIKLDTLDGEDQARQDECVAKCKSFGAAGCQLIWGQHNKGCYAVYVKKASSEKIVGSGYQKRHLCWDFGQTGLVGKSYMQGRKGSLECPKGAEVTDFRECEQAVLSMGLPISNNFIAYKAGHPFPENCAYQASSKRIFFGIKTDAFKPRAHHDLSPVCQSFMSFGADGASIQKNGVTAYTIPDLANVPSAGTYVMNTVEKPAFTSLPSKADALAKLKVGAHRPDEDCADCGGEVKSYTVSGVALAVFEIDGKYYKNIASEIELMEGGKFRNPPIFLKTTNDDNGMRQVYAEVDALLDHLFTHQNTPPFVAKKLIQRFVSSNPSPEYTTAVADAFKTGTYDGYTYSGAYGDLGATVAAILLHPEARELQSSGTSSKGLLREPMLKLMHVMRSMEYKDDDDMPIVFEHLHNVMGQFPYNSPSVFNFFYADYGLPMVMNSAEPEPEPEPEPESESLFGPEFQIFTPPYLVGYLNGMSTLIKSGVNANCDPGQLGAGISFSDEGGSYRDCQGSLKYDGEGSDNATLEELDILLTGGRMTPVSKEVMKHAFGSAVGEKNKLEMAQQAVVMSAEFNTLGAPLPLEQKRPEPAGKPGRAKNDYKAVVMLFMAGGADTWNMLVPLNCDLYKEYQTIRRDLALNPGELQQVNAPGQACAKWGIHSRFKFIKELFAKKQASFVTNVGNLVEPTTVATFRSNDARKCFNLFSHSDQTNGAQTLVCQNAGRGSHGSGGRIADALATGPKEFRSESFSIAGSAAWPEGAETQDEVISERGFTVFRDYEEWMGSITNFTSQRHGNVYAEAYADAFARAVETSNNIGRVLSAVELKTNYDHGTHGLTRQLGQVARLIAAREGRQAERDFFYVAHAGYDMHADLKNTLNQRFEKVDYAIKSFVKEMEAQGIWQNVAIFSSSEFGRTLDSNGGGSDHAWAGQHFILSGGLNGGKIHNKFPATLAAGGPQDLGRGRLIPEYPWESMLVPLANWLGLEESQQAVTFPNLAFFNSSHVVATGDMFK